jgi:hypothetical protein
MHREEKQEDREEIGQKARSPDFSGLSLPGSEITPAGIGV